LDKAPTAYPTLIR